MFVLSKGNPKSINLIKDRENKNAMAGSGTTLKMAKKNNRKYIGIEISKEYIEIINKRLDL